MYCEKDGKEITMKEERKRVFYTKFDIGNGRTVKVLYFDPDKREEKIKNLYEDYPEAVEIYKGYYWE